MKKRFVAPVLRVEADLARLTMGFDALVISGGCNTCDFNIDGRP